MTKVYAMNVLMEALILAKDQMHNSEPNSDEQILMCGLAAGLQTALDLIIDIDTL